MKVSQMMVIDLLLEGSSRHAALKSQQSLCEVKYIEYQLAIESSYVSYLRTNVDIELSMHFQSLFAEMTSSLTRYEHFSFTYIANDVMK